MSAIGLVHLVFSLVAIGAGGAVCLMRKGTRWHRTWGHLYATSMVGVIATAFSIYGLTGSFSVFHLAASVSAVAILGGMGSILLRKPKKGWIESHAYFMVWSYIGLMAAFVAESSTRFLMPVLRPMLEEANAWGLFYGIVGVATFLTVGIGWWLTKTRLPDSIAAAPQSMREERKELGAT